MVALFSWKWEQKEWRDGLSEAIAMWISTMGPFKLSSNQLIPELGICLQLASIENRNVIDNFLGLQDSHAL